MRNIKELGDLIHIAGIKKANYPFLKLFILSIQAGMYIALGGIFYTVVTAYGGQHALLKVGGGIAFSLGLILVVIGNAELFTGNNLMVITLLNKKISLSKMLRNWSFVYLGNFVGAAFIAWLMLMTGLFLENDSALGVRALSIAEYKVSLGFLPCFFRALLCNILVCLAIWSAMIAKTIPSKVLGIIFPISAFVAMGFEHSIANMYFIPMGLLLKTFTDINTSLDILSSASMFQNLVPVTLGNICGGVIFVACSYWFIHREDFKSV